MEKGKGRLINFKKGIDYEKMQEYLETLAEQYNFLGVESLGVSFGGRIIPVISMGRGKKEVLYLGALRGHESDTSLALLKFINEYAEIYMQRGRIYKNRAEDIFEERTIHVIPMFDVDGVEYFANGIKDKDELYDRMCKGEGDGAKESGALDNFIRFNEALRCIVSLRQGKNGLSFFGRGTRALSMAKCFSKMTGFSLDSSIDGENDTEAFLRELEIPHVSLRCGETGKKEDTLFSIYSSAREILFSTPFMI